MKYNSYCLFPGCSVRPCIRGLCTAHYQAALARVKAETTSWEELEILELALPHEQEEQEPELSPGE